MKLFNKESKKNKETRSLPMSKKGKSALTVYSALVLMLCCCTTTAFAASDPLTVTDEAVREVENRLLGVETNITNWQRRQNANNNFSAVVPYDMELQRKESKEFLDDLTTRDQRMMFAVITLAITADTKEQLDSDTEAVLSVARKHMCQLIQHGQYAFEVCVLFGGA